jgi:hypothetical protein
MVAYDYEMYAGDSRYSRWVSTSSASGRSIHGAITYEFARSPDDEDAAIHEINGDGIAVDENTATITLEPEDTAGMVASTYELEIVVANGHSVTAVEGYILVRRTRSNELVGIEGVFRRSQRLEGRGRGLRRLSWRRGVSGALARDRAWLSDYEFVGVPCPCITATFRMTRPVDSALMDSVGGAF